MKMKQIEIRGGYTDEEIYVIVLANTFEAIKGDGLKNAGYRTNARVIADVCRLSYILLAMRDKVQECDKGTVKGLSSEKFTKVVRFNSGLIPSVKILGVLE